ncbi:MAG TPA: AzlD domain-containing protein [Acidimicrobiia bacterium]
MTAWLAVVAAGISVYSLRAVLLLGRFRTPVTIERALVYVAPAALAALAAPAVLSGGGAAVAPRALALAAGVVVAHRSRSIGATVAVGMAVLWIATAALP